MKQTQGWTLVALIVLLTVVLITTAGVTIALAEGLQVSLLRVGEAKAVYLAHAGVMDAIACYRSGNQSNNWFGLGCFGNDPSCDNSPNLNLDPGEVFIRDLNDPQRDFLLVDMSNEGRRTPVMTQRGGNSTFDDWELRRVSDKALTISALEVRWTGAVNSERVTRVCLDTNWNSASCLVTNARSGERITLPNPGFALGATTWISNNHLRFNFRLDQRSPLVIGLTFFLSDACATDAALPSNAPTLAELPSWREAQAIENCRRTAVWVSGSGNDASQNWGLWTVRTTGEFRNVPFTMRRRLRAEFRAHSSSNPQRNQIITWREE